MNKIFVVSGPSGSGKSTLIKLLTQKYHCLKFSVSHTTRKNRDGERNGKEYYFINDTQFREMIAREEFAEWAEVHDRLYGTSLEEIKSKSVGEEILILDIDVQGAEIIKKKFPEAMLVFITPPGIGELKRRIKKREKELTSDFLKRIKTAEEEIAKAGFYDHKMVNDNLEESFEEFERIFLDYKSKVLTDDKNRSKEAGE